HSPAGEIRGIEHFARPHGGTPRSHVQPPGHAVHTEALQTQAAHLINLTNAYRAGRGLTPLRVDGRLSAAARTQADYMARTGHYSHANPAGALPDRVTAAGFSFAWVGENIHVYDSAVGRPRGLRRHYT